MVAVWQDRVEWDTAAQGWWIDGMPLNRLAYRVHQLSGSAPPALRGSNVTTAAEPGARHRGKVHTSRTIQLALWLVPEDGDTLDETFRELWRRLGRHDSQVTLQRRVDVDGRTEQVTADVEVMDKPETSIHRPGDVADVAIDFHMPDPYWYLAKRTKTIASDGKTHRVWNPGTVERHFDVVVTLNGPLTDPTLTNNSLGGLNVSYSGTVADGDTVTLNSREMTAKDQDGNRVDSSVTKSGTWWFEMADERNEITLTSSSGDGTADLVWRPALI
jgi:hypothetical protein